MSHTIPRTQPQTAEQQILTGKSYILIIFKPPWPLGKICVPFKGHLACEFEKRLSGELSWDPFSEASKYYRQDLISDLCAFVGSMVWQS